MAAQDVSDWIRNQEVSSSHHLVYFVFIDSLVSTLFVVSREVTLIRSLEEFLLFVIGNLKHKNCLQKQHSRVTCTHPVGSNELRMG